MKLTKAQMEVIEHAKGVIDYARTHTFHEWFRKNNSYISGINTMTNDDINDLLDKRTANGWVGNWEYEIKHYQLNRDGIDYKCSANSKTIQKLEWLGLITILHDSNGEKYGYDVIRLLNY